MFQVQFNRTLIVTLLMIPLHWVAGGQLLADEVTIVYEAEIATISGNPFGLDISDLNTSVTGFFRYNSDTPDQNASSTRGDYPHDPVEGGLGGGGFEANFSPNSVADFVIAGSETPFVNIEDFASSETFRFRDGPDTFSPGGIMFFNGVLDPNLRLELAITDPSASSFADDSLPGNPFPMNLPPSLPHTFSIRDLSSGGTVLMQFQSLQGVPEPASGLVLVFASMTCLYRRRRIV